MAKLAVIASRLSIARTATTKPYALASPLTPVAFVSVTTVKYCQRPPPNSLRSISSLTILSELLAMQIFSSVKDPIIRTARPGPGNG